MFLFINFNYKLLLSIIVVLKIFFQLSRNEYAVAHRNMYLQVNRVKP